MRKLLSMINFRRLETRSKETMFTMNSKQNSVANYLICHKILRFDVIRKSQTFTSYARRNARRNNLKLRLRASFDRFELNSPTKRRNTHIRPQANPFSAWNREVRVLLVSFEDRRRNWRRRGTERGKRWRGLARGEDGGE